MVSSWWLATLRLLCESLHGEACGLRRRQTSTDLYNAASIRPVVRDALTHARACIYQGTHPWRSSIQLPWRSGEGNARPVVAS
jgi:hypothetical protein